METTAAFPGIHLFSSVPTMIVELIIIAFFVWMQVRILHKAGFSGWWVILAMIPIVNIIAIWVFAFISWPSVKKPVT